MIDVVEQPGEPLLTVSETAGRLNVSQQTVRRMIDRRELRAVRLGRAEGRSIRVPASALEEAIRPVEGNLG